MFIKSKEFINLLMTDGYCNELFDPDVNDSLETITQLKLVKSVANKYYKYGSKSYTLNLESHKFDIRKLFIKNQFKTIFNLFIKYVNLYKMRNEIMIVNPFRDTYFITYDIIEDSIRYLRNTNSRIDSFSIDYGADSDMVFTFYKDFMLFEACDSDSILFPLNKDGNILNNLPDIIRVELFNLLPNRLLNKLTEEQTSEIIALERKLDLEAI